ncbi:DNA polymerase III subunit gamma/tau [uncultured Cyclobacterium sp.]|uniref:DNA polymerase III subunit gamma/tau n=1 Tax=uncultured Cyclobacterium sp. TaxID=453820 RepID=UPI0030EDE687
MENFVVSARKYRPSDFKSVVGQSHITTTLKNAIKNEHLAQAFLFCGPRGVGKTTCARILAKTINCENRKDNGEACNECSSCEAFNSNSSFNVHELDAASNNSVDDMRNLVDQVRYVPQKGKYKVYIIDEVHMLTTQAFNAFLKTLEEPPKHAIFILATTEKHKIIPTILSRCQIFDFNRIQIQDISQHLEYISKEEGVDYETEALRLIATKADGALRDALSIYDLIVTFSAGKKVTYQETIDNLHVLDYDYYFKVTDALLEESISKALLIFDEILKKGFDGHNFLVGLSEHLRELMVCKDPDTAVLLQVSETAKARYVEQSANSPLSFLLSGLSICNQADLSYKASKNQRLHVELVLMKLAKLPHAISLAAVSDQEAKKSLANESEVKAEAAGNAKTSTQPAPAQVIKKTIAIPSNLKAVKNQVKAKPAEKLAEKESTKVAAPVLDDSLPRQPINQDTVKNVFAEVLDEFREDHKNMEMALLNQPFEVRGQEVVFMLSSGLHEDLFPKLKPELTGILRRKLRHPDVEVTFEITEHEKDPIKNLYTAGEKFTYLMEKSPALKELKKRFGLQADF